MLADDVDFLTSGFAFTLLSIVKMTSLQQNPWCTVEALKKTFQTHTLEIEKDRFENRDKVLKGIDSVIYNIVQQISSGESPVLTYSNRTSWDNVTFQEEIGIQAQENTKMTSVRFESQHSLKKFTLTLKVLAVIYRLVQTNSYCTKRDLYYQDPKGFGNQSALDDVVDNISCMLQVPRWTLHVLATSKGCIAGSLTFQDVDGNFVDCKATKSGILVPAHVRALHHMQTDAKVILVVEKDATFQKLLDHEVTKKLDPCIVITGKGFPDVNTRMMLRRLWETFHIPVMALVDADPHGIEIMAVYKYGSRALSHETKYLAVPSLKWLGVLPSDIKRFKITSEALVPLTKKDQDKATELLSRPYTLHFPSLREELELLLQMGYKAEIQSLDSISPSFLTDVYLPGKIQFGGWI